MEIQNILKSKIIKEWINPDFLSEKKINTLKENFTKNIPFRNLELLNFLNLEKAEKLLEALDNEQFYEKESDLFKFLQTNDLFSSENEIIQDFRKFLLSEEFILFIEFLTGLKIKRKTLDLHASIYRYNDFLLCHDDQLEGREIAFLLYLSDFGERDGGSLNLISNQNKVPEKIKKRIIPKFNKFALFQVSEISFHEVEENISNELRVAIGGWYHGNQ